MHQLTFSPMPNAPLYRQLYEMLLGEIRRAGLAPGERLPSRRALAAHLGLSINTVDSAYQMLVAEGYVQAVPKSGYYVCPQGVSGLVPPPENPQQAAPGTVLALKPLTIACARGALQLLTVTPEGGRPMAGTAWAAGRRLHTGDSL